MIKSEVKIYAYIILLGSSISSNRQTLEEAIKLIEINSFRRAQKILESLIKTNDSKNSVIYTLLLS